MSALLLSPPATEPISLAEAKAWLRVEHNDEDDTIAALIAGSRIHVEDTTRRALMTQSWRLSLDRWPRNGRIAVRPGTLQTLDAARVYDAVGGTQALDVAAFAVDPFTSALAFAPGAMPAPGRLAGGIEIDVTVGYGDDPEDVPEALRQAIRLLVAHWHENRGIVTTGPNYSPLPQTIGALIAPYRLVSL